MKPECLFLGIDTSNYTTSSALCDGEGRVLLNCKVPLPVKEGERGLRQSDAVFHHVKNLPSASGAVREILRSCDSGSIAAIGCSATPRDSEGSYMPCFLAGVSSGEYLAAVLDVPMVRLSHQAGHIMAALYSACEGNWETIDTRMASPFLAFHVSGGTTDLLLCEPDEERIFRITQIGGSEDINGGQAIDRTGVRMGLSFPCGAEMDRAAMTYRGGIQKWNLSVHGTRCNLSGLENRAEKLYQESGNVAETSAYTLDFIGRTLEKMTKNAWEQVGKLPVVYAGGVMSSRYIRRMLESYGLFAEPAFSADNAAGIALLTREYVRRDRIGI